MISAASRANSMRWSILLPATLTSHAGCKRCLLRYRVKLDNSWGSIMEHGPCCVTLTRMRMSRWCN